MTNSTSETPMACKTLTTRRRTWKFSCPRNGTYRIFPITNQETHKRAQRLLNCVYQNQGYAKNNDDPTHLLNPQTERPMLTLLAEDAQGESAGTVSLNLDSAAGLPCDEIFGEELSPLRARGQTLVEVTGLALATKHTRSKALLVHLMNFVLITARRICHSDTVLIEVNPRHENFYRKLLKFEEAGPVRSCRRVHGAPARLLSLDMDMQREAVRSEAGNANSPKGRSIYKHFYTLSQEVAIARVLKDSTEWTKAIRNAKGVESGQK